MARRRRDVVAHAVAMHQVRKGETVSKLKPKQWYGSGPAPEKKATGWHPKRDGPTSLERAYMDVLRARFAKGEVLWWVFEAVKLRLADNTQYTADFFLMVADGTLEVHETKGFWAEHNRVKIKVAAATFPFRFIAVTRQKKKDGGAWMFEEFNGSNIPLTSALDSGDDGLWS